MTSLATAPRVPLRLDARTIGLVGLAHGTSHFFQLLLPPLFPAFIRDFGLSYSELGLLVSIFFVISGIGQATAGFVVDRVGARPVLYAALGCFALASVAAALAAGFAGLALASVLAGLGNSPFHPVDFTILNRRVSSPRLGHAFSAHGISGNLGWAAAPAFLVGLSALAGSWRWACAGAGAVALLVLALLVQQRHAIDDRPGRHSRPESGPAQAAADEDLLAFLKLPSVWLCFMFFFWSTVTLSAIQGFASPALGRMYGLPPSATAFVVTGYMLSSAAGMVAGGFLVPRVERLEVPIAASMAAASLALLLVSSGWLPGMPAVAVAALAGLGAGVAAPSRDMLIRRAAPPGATGRVYGTVYSGLDVGFALAAPAFGWLLDHGQPNAVFAGAAAALALGIASAALVGLQLRSPRAGVPAPRGAKVRQ